MIITHIFIIIMNIVTLLMSFMFFVYMAAIACDVGLYINLWGVFCFYFATGTMALMMSL